MSNIFFDGVERVHNYESVKLKDYDLSALFNNVKYTLIWYGLISNGSNRRNSIKLVEMIFINNTNGYQVTAKIPFEMVPKMPIGSIWCNGETTSKYQFKDYSIVIEEDASNLQYSNHFGIKKNGGDYEFELDAYPVSNLDSDENTLLIIKQGDTKVIIHPQTFFNAHYGVSKEIDRILLTYLWTDVETHLRLNRLVPEQPIPVEIPDACVIGDAVFLHYLNNNEDTRNKVFSLNDRCLKNMRRRKSKTTPLKVEPYHDQEIEINFKGHSLGNNTILCTQITGMSMPKGEDIFYTLNERAKNIRQLNQPINHSFKPLYHQIIDGEIVLEVDRDADNSITAVIRHRITPIGKIRNLIRIRNLTDEQAIRISNSEIIPLDEPIPDTFATGERTGVAGTVGMFKMLVQSKAADYDDHSFKRLLRYAQALKYSPDYQTVNIDCYSNEELHGETVEEVNKPNHTSNVLSVYVLRLELDDSIYYFFDCDMAKGAKTSGIAIKINEEQTFLMRGVDEALSQLFDNNGRLSDQERLDNYGDITKYIHANYESSNWIETALSKL